MPFVYSGPFTMLADELSNVSTNGSCPGGNQLIWTTFSQCIESWLEWASFWVGIASILCWLVVLMPQLVTNCKKIKGVASISWGLLICWFIGDSTNLVGAFLTNQGAFQVALGFWFMVTDVVFFSQMVYYQACVKRSLKEATEKSKLPGRQIILCLMGLFVLAGTFEKTPMDTPFALSDVRYGRTILSSNDENATTTFFSDTQNILGYALGVLSAVAYTFSRMFQIVKNFREKNVTGLERKTFILCVVGNLLYGLAIFLYSTSSDYLIQHAPWIVGSWGIMMLDATIIYQITTYSNEFDNLLNTSINVGTEDEDARLINPVMESYGSVA